MRRLGDSATVHARATHVAGIAYRLARIARGNLRTGIALGTERRSRINDFMIFSGLGRREKRTRAAPTAAATVRTASDRKTGQQEDDRTKQCQFLHETISFKGGKGLYGLERFNRSRTGRRGDCRRFSSARVLYTTLK